MKINLQKLRKLKKKSMNVNDFAKKSCDEGLTISMSQGRRLFHTIEEKKDEV